MFHGNPASQGPYKASDRKSTRLNSSHDQISYAVFCLKKKKNTSVRSRHLARQHRIRRKRSTPNVFKIAPTETPPTIIVNNHIRVRHGTVHHPSHLEK